MAWSSILFDGQRHIRRTRIPLNKTNLRRVDEWLAEQHILRVNQVQTARISFGIEQEALNRWIVPELLHGARFAHPGITDAELPKRSRKHVEKICDR